MATKILENQKRRFSSGSSESRLRIRRKKRSVAVPKAGSTCATLVDQHSHPQPVGCNEHGGNVHMCHWTLIRILQLNTLHLLSHINLHITRFLPILTYYYYYHHFFDFRPHTSSFFRAFLSAATRATTSSSFKSA